MTDSKPAFEFLTTHGVEWFLTEHGVEWERDGDIIRVPGDLQTQGPMGADFFILSSPPYFPYIFAGGPSGSWIVVPNKITITTTSLPPATFGQPYELALTATGGQGVIQFSVAAGSILPEGFTLSSGGVLKSTGKPAAAPSDYSFVVAARDAAGDSSLKKLSLLVSPLPKIVLTRATTVDSQSVSVNYTISQSNISEPLTFDFYRSDVPSLTNNSVHIGVQSIPASQGYIGNHTVQFVAGIGLTPDAKLPYVVVVANQGNLVADDSSSVLSTYFRKYLLGVVVHGYDPTATVSTATPGWEVQMCVDMVSLDGFDYVIPFNWESTCSVAKPGLVVAAGNALVQEIYSSPVVLDEAPKHAGDVVDIHFIGHSRGTVVVSQVLQYFVHRIPADLKGSYIEVTLLDPHPANPQDDNLLSYVGLTGYDLDLKTIDFQALANDPPIVLPLGANIKTIDVLFQQTAAKYFPVTSTEYLLNLWGEGGGSADNIVNLSGVPIHFVPLTAKTTPATGLIGHYEVHEYFRFYTVDAGTFY